MGRPPSIAPKQISDKSGGIMRWNYEQPTPQVILNNGRELSIYTPRDHDAGSPLSVRWTLITPTPCSPAANDWTRSLFSARLILFQMNTPPKDLLGDVADPAKTTPADQTYPDLARQATPHPQQPAPGGPFRRPHGTELQPMRLNTLPPTMLRRNSRCSFEISPQGTEIIHQ